VKPLRVITYEIPRQSKETDEREQLHFRRDFVE
jgi:hypothetical protein